MEQSILNSTKKVLGMDASYTVFDHDIITFINSAFFILHDLGLGQEEGFMITGVEDVWDDFLVPQPDLNLVKTYVFLKVRMLFDPPTTSFLIEAMNNQIAEYEWRLNVSRENSMTFPLVVVD